MRKGGGGDVGIAGVEFENIGESLAGGGVSGELQGFLRIFEIGERNVPTPLAFGL